VLLTRVEYLKPGTHKSFAIVDAAMNDLLRPALYDAWHPVDPVRPRGGDERRWEIVGPVCESGDFLAHDRSLALAAGDLLAVARGTRGDCENFRERAIFFGVRKAQQSRMQAPESPTKSCKTIKRGYNAGSRRNGFVNRFHEILTLPEPPARREAT
jgi:hypothetical protein